MIITEIEHEFVVFLYRTMNAIVITTKAKKKLEGDKREKCSTW